MKFNKCILIITGCISPNSDVPVLKLTDSDERRKQYIQSIKYYIESSPFENIVFCDNSNAEVEDILFALAKKNNKQFEWLSFNGDQEKVVQYGKGYGEGEIMDYVLNHSVLIEDAEILVKTTGRLMVKNCGFILRFANPCVAHFMPVRVSDRRPYIDTRIYMMPKECYQRYFRWVHIDVDDRNGTYLEHTFGAAVREHKIPYKRFLVAPNIWGMSGSVGTIYRPNLLKQLKHTIKMYLVKLK